MPRKKTKKERIIVLLDGSNFYHRLRDRELNFKNILLTKSDLEPFFKSPPSRFSRLRI